MGLSGSSVSGLEEVTGRINAAMSGMSRHGFAGMYRLALKVQALAQQRVPVEYGFLRASAYTTVQGDTSGGTTLGGDLSVPTIEVGFSADYAIYVHENMEQKWKGRPRRSGIGVYWGPQGRPKFLESAWLDLEGEFLATIEASMKPSEWQYGKGEINDQGNYVGHGSIDPNSLWVNKK